MSENNRDNQELAGEKADPAGTHLLKHLNKNTLTHLENHTSATTGDQSSGDPRVLGMERCCVLFVDRADDTWQQQLDLKRLEATLHAESARCLYARSYEHAIEITKQISIDLIVVDPALHSKAVTETVNGKQEQHISFESFCQDVKAEEGGAEMLILTRQRKFDHLLHWMRLGASDCLVLPDDVQASSDLLLDRLALLWRKRLRERRGLMASRQLVRKCEKLADSKREAQEELETVCKKMTAKYEALASQLNRVAMESEYGATVQGELEIESLLRKTLGYLLDKAGAVNAVIFLPVASEGPAGKIHYALGGYLESVEGGLEIATLQRMSTNLAPAVARRAKSLHLTDDARLTAWLGDDALNGQHLYAIPSNDENDVLAVLVLARESDQPFLTVEVEAFDCVASLLGGFLARLLRVHHRLNLDQLTLKPGTDAYPFEDEIIYGEAEDDDALDGVSIDDDQILSEDVFEDGSSLEGLSLEEVEGIEHIVEQTEASIEEIDELLNSADLHGIDPTLFKVDSSEPIEEDGTRQEIREEDLREEKSGDGSHWLNDRRKYLDG